MPLRTVHAWVDHIDADGKVWVMVKNADRDGPVVCFTELEKDKLSTTDRGNLKLGTHLVLKEHRNRNGRLEKSVVRVVPFRKETVRGMKSLRRFLREHKKEHERQ